MSVKVIIVALGVLLATVVIAALVSTITAKVVLPHSETATGDTHRTGIWAAHRRSRNVS